MGAHGRLVLQAHRGLASSPFKVGLDHVQYFILIRVFFCFLYPL